MPAAVSDDPLTLQFEFPNGTSWAASLADLPNLELARDLAQGLVQLVHPHGTVASKPTAVSYVVSVRKLVSALSIAGFLGGAADLTRTVMIPFWLSHSHDHERNTRRLLSGFDSVAHQLRPDLREQIAGRMRQQRARTKPYEPYTETEWQLLTDCCTGIVDEARQRHTQMLGIAQLGTDPKEFGISQETVAWWILRNGPETVKGLTRYLGRSISRKRERALASTLVHEVKEALFPTPEVQFAYRLLFSIRTGIVSDGVDGLDIDSVSWAGSSTVLLDYVKGRTGREGISLPPSATKLLRQWLEHSEPLRKFAPPDVQDMLWISTSPRDNRTRVVSVAGQPGKNAIFSRDQGLLADDGSPLQIHRGRIRATYLNLLSRRGWTGRTTIDPNHSASVEGDHYLTATTPAQLDAVESIIEDGQADVIRKALPPTVLTETQVAELVTEIPTAVGRHRMDNAAIVELVGGEKDVFVSACTDQLAGLWGPVGKPCPARPWVCLLCPLAVFLPHHAPNLLRLKAFFARQFRQMSTDQFMKVFGPYAHRLDNEILPLFDAEVLDRATVAVRDDDSEIPLRPEETT